MAATSADFGLIGLAVMGENLALNVESRGYKVAVFNRTTEKVDAFIEGRAKGKNFIGCHSIEELVKKVKKPRKIMMMVKAGQPVAKVGRTGDASACHIHFGLSPACQKTGDWFTRRGVIWPWSYLDAWKAGTEKSPVADVEQWQRQHGCPTKPLVNP